MDAEQHFRKALAVRADLHEVHYSLGLLLAEEQRYEEAVEHLQSAANAMPAYPRVHYNLGQLWDYLKADAKAQLALEKAYRLAPENPDHQKALFQFYLKHQKHAELKNIAEQTLANNPQHKLSRQLLQYLNN